MADRVCASNPQTDPTIDIYGSNRSVQFTPAHVFVAILLVKFSGKFSYMKKCFIWKKIAPTVNNVNPTVKDAQKRYKTWYKLCGP